MPLGCCHRTQARHTPEVRPAQCPSAPSQTAFAAWSRLPLTTGTTCCHAPTACTLINDEAFNTPVPASWQTSLHPELAAPCPPSDSPMLRVQAMVEGLLKEYPNVLVLRVRMPIVADLTYARNFITKIIKYDKVSWHTRHSNKWRGSNATRPIGPAFHRKASLQGMLTSAHDSSPAAGH